MKRVMVALIAGTVLSGMAAAYASTIPAVASNDERAPAPAKAPQGATHRIAASD